MQERRASPRRQRPVSARHGRRPARSHARPRPRYRSTTPGAWRADRGQVGAQRADVAAGDRSGQRGPDPERPGVAEGLLDQRPVDRQRAGLVEAGHPAQLGDRVEEGDEARRRPARRPRGRRPSSPAPGGRPSPRSPRPSRRAGRPAGRRPRPRSWRRGARRPPARCRRRRRAGGTSRSGSRRPWPAEDLGAERRRWCGPWPGRRTAGGRRPAPAMASSGTARMTSSTSSRIAVASANARVPPTSRPEPLAPAGVPAGDRRDRPAGPAQGHAEGRPDRARADDPDAAAAGRARRGRCGWRWSCGPAVVVVDRPRARGPESRSRPASRGDRRPGGHRSRRPAAGRRSRLARGRSLQAFIGGGTIPCHESSERAQRGVNGASSTIRFAARAEPRAGRCPTTTAFGARARSSAGSDATGWRPGRRPTSSGRR